MATTTLLQNQAISAPVTTAGFPVSASVAYASFSATLVSPNVALAVFEFMVELSDDNGVSWSGVGGSSFANNNGETRDRAGNLLPISQTNKVSFQMPDNASGDKIRFRVTNVTGGAWIVSANMTT
jgi:hypothetical protein